MLRGGGRVVKDVERIFYEKTAFFQSAPGHCDLPSSSHWLPIYRPAIAFEKFLALGTAVSFSAARTATNDPFVYRLGLQIFILARRVRFPYGSPSGFR